MTQIIKLELVIRNNDKYDSCVFQEGDCNTFGDPIPHLASFFEEGLREILLQAFDDMWNNLQYRIHRLKCSGSVIPFKRTGVALSLSDIIHLNTENMEILTRRGFMTFSSFKEGATDNVSRALMLLVWEWSRHFKEEDRYRTCLACSKVQWKKPTGQYIDGREIYTTPTDYCFNPNCFSHEIERMINPAYVFVPPKPGEDLETDLARALGEKVVKKDHPMGTGVVKKGVE